MRRRSARLLLLAATLAGVSALCAALLPWRAAPTAPATPLVAPAVQYRDLASRRGSTPGAGVRADLSLPPRIGPRPPLALVIPGGLREMPDMNDVLGPAAADALVRRGLAVAVIQVTLAEDYRLPRATEDVAAVVRELLDRADALGCDAAHPALLGHGLGAWMASLLALDPRLRAAADLERRAPRAVVAMRGTYDLASQALAGASAEPLFSWAFEGDPSARAAASPLSLVRADAPPFLLLTAAEDTPEWSRNARAFATALERAGAKDVERHAVAGRDAWSLFNLGGGDNPLGALVASFLARGPTPAPIDGPFGAEQRWSARPPLSTEPFWQDPALVHARPVDDALKRMLARVYRESMYELDAYPLREYHAVELREWLASRPPGELGKGEWLTLTNFRGERLYLSQKDLEQYAPVLVVGIDDERNLFRLTATYRLKRAYSWKPEEGTLPLMIRPVGAFLHFPNGAPPELASLSYAPFGLTTQSFRRSEQDPLGPVRGLSPELRRALAGEEGCLTCHTLRGAGAKAHHVTAERGEAHGAFALPLEEYPAEVLRRFLEHQDELAASFGVAPLRVEKGAAQALFALVAPAGK